MSEARPLIEPRADEAPDRIAWLRDASEKLQGLLHLNRGWDSYEADPPNQSAIRRAEQVLTAVNSTPYRPDRIAPSIEGGVVLSFRHGDRYGDIECDNEGDMVAVVSDGQGHVDAWQVANDSQSVEDAVRKIGLNVYR
jgi:hypothetical protein